LAAAGADRTLRFWDWAGSRELASVNSEFEISTVVFLPSPAESTVLMTSGNTTQIYNLKQLKPPVIVVPSESAISSIALSPMENTLPRVNHQAN